MTSRGRSQWSTTALLTVSPKPSATHCHCRLPRRMAAQLAGSSLVVLEVRCATAGAGGGFLFIPWSGEVSQQHPDCLEMPAEYATANGLAAPSPPAAGTAPAALPVTVTVVPPHAVLRLADAVLVPSSMLDWQVVYTHKTLIEDSLLQKHVRLPVLPSLTINLTVQSVCPEGDEGDGGGGMSVGSGSKTAGLRPVVVEQQEDPPPSSGWPYSVYASLCASAVALDQLCNEPAPPPSSLLASSASSSRATNLIGLLSSRTTLTIASPPEEEVAPREILSSQEEGHGLGGLPPQLMCQLTGHMPLRLLPARTQCGDTSYFGCERGGNKESSELVDLDSVLNELDNEVPSVGGDESFHHDSIEDFHGEYAESLCTCIVHPLLFIGAEEMAKGSFSMSSVLGEAWREVALEGGMEEAAPSSRGALWFLGKLETASQWSGASFIYGSTQPLPQRESNELAATQAGPVEDGAGEGMTSMTVRVLISAAVRPHHIFVSRPARRALGLGDSGGATVRLTIVSPAACPPLQPAAVQYRISHLPPCALSSSFSHTALLDNFRLALLGMGLRPEHPSCTRQQQPRILPSGAIITFSATTRAGARQTAVSCKVCFGDLDSGQEVQLSSEGVAGDSMETGGEDCSSSSQGTEMRYMRFTTENEFLTFVHHCCAAYSSNLASCSHALSKCHGGDMEDDKFLPALSPPSANIPIPGDAIATSLADMFGIRDVVSSLSGDLLSQLLPLATLQRIAGASVPPPAPPLAGPLGSLVVGAAGTGKSCVLRGLASSLCLSPRLLVNPVMIACRSHSGAETDHHYRVSSCSSLHDITSKLRRIFDEAFVQAPSVLCLDDLDALCGSMVTEENEPAHDAGAIIKNEKICDCLEDLLRITQRNNEQCALSARRTYELLSLHHKKQEESGRRAKLEGVGGDQAVDKDVQECDMELFRAYDPWPVWDQQQEEPTPLAYAAHRVATRGLSKVVYVLASASSPQALHPRLTDLLTLGRNIELLPSSLPSLARVSILRNALLKLGWPLQLGDGEPSSRPHQQQRQRRGELAIEKLTEGYQPTDLWALARRVVSACFTEHPLSTSPTVASGLKRSQQRQSHMRDVVRACEGFTPPSELLLRTSSTPSAGGGQCVQPSDPSLSWGDVGGYAHVKKALFDTFRRPLLFRKLYVRNQLPFPRGVLLFGPPGTGKTQLARAAGEELGLALVAVRGPELLNKYIGESERAVRSLFDKARSLGRPCLIFFDEFEALAPKRGADSSGGVSDRIVNQLLTYLDGVESTMGSADLTGGQIFILAATSRPDLIDSALLRPGRIARHVYVGLPDLAARREILQTRLSEICLSNREEGDDVQVTLEGLLTSTQAETMTGADWKGVIDTAFLQASATHVKTRKKTKGTETEPVVAKAAAPTLNDHFPLTSAHFLDAFAQIQPSLSAEELLFYANIHQKFIPSASTDLPVSSSRLRPLPPVTPQKQCFA